MLLLPANASSVVRAFSFGGGVDSHAALVLQVQGELHYDLFIFANVGHDSENPDTLAYIKNYTKPFCEQHGIKFIEVAKTRRSGEAETLWAYLHRTPRSVPIPARMGGNGAPGNRSCTEDFKVKVVDRYLRLQGYTHAVIGLGISFEEWWRIRDQQWYSDNGLMKRREYPLVDLRLTRQQSKALIAEAGLPEPPKSSCFFCPFHKRNEWIEMKREHPDLFQRAVDLEHMINHKREKVLMKDRLYLHPDVVPLEHAVGDQLPLFPDEALSSCDSGYCWT